MVAGGVVVGCGDAEGWWGGGGGGGGRGGGEVAGVAVLDEEGAPLVGVCYGGFIMAAGG